MPYRIDYSEQAYRDVRLIPAHLRRLIRQQIEALAINPRPLSSKELRDLDNVYRVRVGQWRLIYNVDDKDEIVLVMRIKRKTGPETYYDLN